MTPTDIRSVVSTSTLIKFWRTCTQKYCWCVLMDHVLMTWTTSSFEGKMWRSDTEPSSAGWDGTANGFQVLGTAYQPTWMHFRTPEQAPLYTRLSLGRVQQSPRLLFPRPSVVGEHFCSTVCSNCECSYPNITGTLCKSASVGASADSSFDPSSLLESWSSALRSTSTA